jgi:hypothetical protein
MASRFKRELNRHVLPPVTSTAARLLGGTWDYVETNKRVFEQARRSGRPLIGAFFHGRSIPLIRYMSLPAHRTWSLMVSTSADGDLMAGTLQRLGFRIVRGSSGRGGAKALIEMIRQTKREPDVHVSMALDGSRGPRGHVQEGTVILAQKTGGLIMPVGPSTRKAWILNTWDRYMVPRPYARIQMVFGELIEVPRRLNAAGVERYRRILEDAALAVTRQADARAGFSDVVPLQAPVRG